MKNVKAINLLQEAIEELNNESTTKSHRFITKLPKNIWDAGNGKFGVSFHSKKLNKTILNKKCKSMSEAILLRDSLITEHINGDLEGYTPRGIGYLKERNLYLAYVHINSMRVEIGTFQKIEDAIEARVLAIDSLK